MHGSICGADGPTLRRLRPGGAHSTSVRIASFLLLLVGYPALMFVTTCYSP